jgi:hypothetical protein
VSISHGKEGITFAGGSRLLFIARSRTSGRGFSPDTVFLDEAFELDDLALAALKPSLAAAKAPQLWYASSAPHETSTVLRRLAIKGRAGEAERLTYLEWCAPDGLGPGDIKAWQAANPALGSRIELSFVASELDSLQPEDFDRERLGRWQEESTGGPIDRATWDALACHLCGRPMLRGQLLDLDHGVDRVGYRGMAHRSCNRRDGALRGNWLRKRRSLIFPNWKEMKR